MASTYIFNGFAVDIYREHPCGQSREFQVTSIRKPGSDKVIMSLAVVAGWPDDNEFIDGRALHGESVRWARAETQKLARELETEAA